MKQHYKRQNGKNGKKFMQVLDLNIWKQLQNLAKGRGVTVQEYLRVIVIPDHLKLKFGMVHHADFRTNMKKSRAAKKAWKKRKGQHMITDQALPEQIPVTTNISETPTSLTQ